MVKVPKKLICSKFVRHMLLSPPLIVDTSVVSVSKTVAFRLVETQIKTHQSTVTSHPDGNYMFKVDNRNTRARCKICSKLTIKTPE